MKKFIFLAIVSVYLFMCSACNSDDIPDDTPDDTSVDSSTQPIESTADTVDTPTSFIGSGLREGYFASLDANYREITLPEEGETLNYDQPFVLFESADGKRLSITAVTRVKNAFYFYSDETVETDYYFIDVNMYILTSDNKVFAAFTPCYNTEHDYVIYEYKGQGYPTPAGEKETVMKQHGDAYDAAKSYYRVQTFTCIDKEVFENSMRECEQMQNQDHDHDHDHDHIH